jgi:hypothetical protein
MDVEKDMTQIKYGLRNNIQVLPSNMVNMLQLVIGGGCIEDENKQDETL